MKNFLDKARNNRSSTCFSLFALKICEFLQMNLEALRLKFKFLIFEIELLTMDSMSTIWRHWLLSCALTDRAASLDLDQTGASYSRKIGEVDFHSDKADDAEYRRD